MNIVRIPAGWLAIPASLFLLVGCTTTELPIEPGKAHSASAHEVAGSPFEQVFGGEADFVILTFYDLYCVACQQSADNFSALHTALGSTLKNRIIQMTGVGIGDTEFELNVFQRRYKLPYTSLPDPEKAFETPFAIKGTPTVLAFKREGDTCREIYRHEGRFRDSDIEKLLVRIQESDSH